MTVGAAPIQPRDLRAAFRLSRERLARLIGVSSKTVERWEARPAHPARDDVRARMAKLRQVAELGTAVYSAEGLADFLSAPLSEFDGLTGMQLLERGEADRVLAALAADYEGAGYQVRSLSDLVGPWSGTLYRHIPADSPYGVRDLRFAGRRSSGRWHWQGQPTLYLASDGAVAIGEFARHLAVDRGGEIRSARRTVYELGARFERVIDLRDRAVLAAIGRDDAPACWLDVRIARAVATFFRDSLEVQALIVPSVVHLDDPARYNVVAFLENLPDEPRAFLPRARKRATVTVEPVAPDDGSDG